MKKLLKSFVLFAALSGLISGPASAQTPEIRAVWSSRFGWPGDGSASSAQTIITQLLNNTVAGRFNTLLFQVRGQCDVMYPSPYEPWSPIITSPDGVHPGWDPLQFAIDGARARNLKIHAYFNIYPIWQGAAPSIARYPDHIYYQHGNILDPAHRDWLLHDSAGNPTIDGEYVLMNPGLPDADAYIRKQAMYLVENYDIDGLHFDRARLPEPGYGRIPAAVARWNNPATPTPNDGPGNPNLLGWDDFMRGCVTRLMMDIAGQAWLAKRHVLMSSSPLGLWRSDAYGYPTGYQYGYTRAQDAKAWMQTGAQDFVIPQIYWANGGATPDFDHVFNDWITAANAAGRALVPGSNLSNGQPEVQAHALYARNQGAAGHCVWHAHHASFDFPDWAAAGKPYAGTSTPPVPDFPWRNTEGVITGHVFSDQGGATPTVDAWITRSGAAWTALSSGDGFFCFLRVPPGTYTLTLKHPSFGPTQTRTISNVTVVAGQATNVTSLDSSVANWAQYAD